MMINWYMRKELKEKEQEDKKLKRYLELCPKNYYCLSNEIQMIYFVYSVFLSLLIIKYILKRRDLYVLFVLFFPVTFLILCIFLSR